MTDIQNIIDRIKEKFFLLDPLYFMTLCLHKISITSEINCNICTGNGTIYINPNYIKNISDQYVEELLKIELIHCLLGHPYRTQNLNKPYAYIASNFICANNLKLSHVLLKKPCDFFKSHAYDKLSLEDYYDMIVPKDNEQAFTFSDSPSSNNLSDNNFYTFNDHDDMCTSIEDAYNHTQMWTDNECMINEIKNLIDKINTAENTNIWGSIPANIQNEIKEHTKIIFNYRVLFHQFKSSLPATSRTVTRMKPNRRYACTPQAFGSIGSKRNETSKLLVAIDVSGSITDDEYSRGLSFINGFFSTNIESIWSIEWDVNVSENSFKKYTKRIPTKVRDGYGGTDVSCVFRWIEKNNQKFNGCIIFTDGEFNILDLRNYKLKGTKLLFILTNKDTYKNFKSRIEGSDLQCKNLYKYTYIQ